jgi:hypothetical protein
MANEMDGNMSAIKDEISTVATPIATDARAKRRSSDTSVTTAHLGPAVNLGTQFDQAHLIATSQTQQYADLPNLPLLLKSIASFSEEQQTPIPKVCATTP